MKRTRSGSSVTEVLIALVIALLVFALMMAFLRSTRLHEARTARRLDHLTEATRFTRALASDLRAAYVSGSRQPQVAAGGQGLSLHVCRGLPAHPALPPELALVTYACDAGGTLTRSEGGTSRVIARLPGGRVAFEVAPGASSVLVRAVVEPGSFASPGFGAGGRKVVVERVLCTATGTPGAVQWIGPGAPAPAPAPSTPAD